MNKYTKIVNQLFDKAAKLPEADFGLELSDIPKSTLHTRGKFYHKPKNIRRYAAAIMAAVFVFAVGISIGINSGFQNTFHVLFAPEKGTLQSGLSATEASNAALTTSKGPSGLSKIPFTLGVYKNIHSKVYNTAPDFSAQIIRSMAELQEKYNAEGQAVNYISKYDDHFFDNNAVVFIIQKHTSGSIRDRINFISKSGNQLVIDYTTLKPTLKTGDLACWRILLEVKKSDVAGAAKITPQLHEEALPDGISFKDDSLEYLGT